MSKIYGTLLWSFTVAVTSRKTSFNNSFFITTFLFRPRKHLHSQIQSVATVEQGSSVGVGCVCPIQGSQYAHSNFNVHLSNLLYITLYIINISYCSKTNVEC